MKIVVGFLASISLLLASCGGDSGNTGVTTAGTYKFNGANIAGTYGTGCVLTNVGSAKYVLTVVSTGTDTANVSLRAQLYPTSQNAVASFRVSDNSFKFDWPLSVTPAVGICTAVSTDIVIEGQVTALSTLEAYDDWARMSGYGWANQLTFRLNNITFNKGSLDVSVPAYGVTTTLGYLIYYDELYFLYGPPGPPPPLLPGQPALMVDGRLVTSLRSMDWTYLTKIP